jgi:hypothetical protein
VAWRSSGAQPTKPKPLAVMSVYGSGLLLVVALAEVLLVTLVDVEDEVVVGAAEELVVDVVKVDELLLAAELLLVDVVVVVGNDDDEDTAAPFLNTESRNPAPQVSSALPLQGKLQSVAGAGTEPALNEFPQ